MIGFVKFPSTPYLLPPSGVSIRDDKVFSDQERETFLSRVLRIEEKVDGENLGISAPSESLRFQARGSYVELGGRHFRGLETWVAPRSRRLARGIGEDLVLFGEWCADVHSVAYDRLPDWFLLFDVYERSSSTFWSSTLRDAFAADLGLSVTPCLGTGRFSESDLMPMLGPSRLGSQPMEGLVARSEDANTVHARAKVVRPGFVQSIEEHWTTRSREMNRLATPG